jgi:hypothetical protein
VEASWVMPFTIAHAAAAPPLWRLSRRRLVLSALAVGAMAPDFEFLVHLAPRRTIGHTLPGVFLLCLPASLVVLLAWHRLLGPALGRLLPVRFAALASLAARPFGFLPARRLLLVCASVVVGSFSHLCWDAFTHRNGAVVARLGVLHDALWAGGPPVYQVLQYGSSAVGLLLLLAWLEAASRRRPKGPAPAPAAPRLRWSVLGALMAACTIAAAANALRFAAAGHGGKDVLVGAVLGAMSAGALGALAASALVLSGRRAAGRAGG